MGDKDFLRYLENGDYLRCRILIERGILVDFAIQYEAYFNGRRYPVVRYDGSHDRGHRDIPNARGETVDKQWLPEHMDMNTCVSYAEAELMENWESYRQRFQELYL